MNIKAFWQKSRSSPIINIDYWLLNACLKTIHAHIIFSIKLTDLHGEIRWPVGDRADRWVWDLRPQQLLDPETEERRRDFTSKEYQQLKAVFCLERVQTHVSLFRRQSIIMKTVMNRKLRHTTTTIISTSPSASETKHTSQMNQSQGCSTYKTSSALKSTPNTYRTSAFWN